MAKDTLVVDDEPRVREIAAPVLGEARLPVNDHVMAAIRALVPAETCPAGTALRSVHAGVGYAPAEKPGIQELELPPAMAAERRAADRQDTIEQHLALVRYVANSVARHVGQSVLLDYDDLLSYGYEGLIAAVDSFDATRGAKFSTWAVMHIRTTIQDALRTLDPLSRSLRANGKEIDRVSYELAHAQGTWPESEQIARALGVSMESFRRTQQELARIVVSLEQVEASRSGNAPGDETNSSLLSVLADDDPEGSPEERLDKLEFDRMLNEAIAALPDREQTLINAHYRKNLSMRAVSHLFGVSESRISQLHARAVRLLQEYLKRAESPVLHPEPLPVKATAKRTPLPADGWAAVACNGQPIADPLRRWHSPLPGHGVQRSGIFAA